MKSIVKGDPDAGGMIRGAFKDAIDSFIPHKD